MAISRDAHSRAVTRLAALGLALLLLSGAAAASSDVEGEVTVKGKIHLASGGQVTGQPLAFFLGDSENVTYFHAEFSYVKVFHRTKTSRDVGQLTDIPGQSSNQTSSWFLHNARMELVGREQDGILGVFPDEGAKLEATLPPGADLTAAPPGKYGDAVSLGGPWAALTGKEPAPSRSPTSAHYELDVDDAHVRVTSPTSALYQGPGAMKIFGLDLRVASDEGTMTFATGATRTETVPEDEVEEWVYLEFSDARIWVDSSNPLDVALEAADVAWSGTVRIQPIEGELALDNGPFRITGAPVEVVGDVAAHAEPIKPEHFLLVLGDAPVAPSTVTSKALIPGTPLSPWSAALLLAIALGAGGATTWFVRRRAQGAMDADELLTLAHLAGEGGRHDEALGWIRRARAIAPESGALALEEAFHLGELGLVDEALAMYREAAGRLGDGQAEFDAALLGLASGALSPVEVEALLVTALDRNPALLLELEEHPVMRGHVVVGVELGAAMRAARRRLGEP